MTQISELARVIRDTVQTAREHKSDLPDLPQKGMPEQERLARERERTRIAERNIAIGNSRRTLLKTAGVVGVAAVGSIAVGVNFLPNGNTVRKKEYEYAEGEPINEQHLGEMLIELKKTGHPYLGKIADDIGFLHTTTQKPAEFPTWVAADFVPFKITVTSNDTSVARTRVSRSEDMQFSAKDINGQVLKVPKLDSVHDGVIELGLADYIREGGRLAQAYYLAKEYVSQMTILQMMREMARTADPRILDIKNIDGSAVAVTDQEIAGASVFAEHIKTGPRSPIWRIADGFPALLLTESIDVLVRQNKLPRASQALHPFYTLGQFIQDNIPAARKIIEVNTQWVNSKKLLPPDGISFAAFSDPLYTPVENFERQIHKIDK